MPTNLYIVVLGGLAAAPVVVAVEADVGVGGRDLCECPPPELPPEFPPELLPPPSSLPSLT